MINRRLFPKTTKLLTEMLEGDVGIEGNATSTDDTQGDHLYAPGDARVPKVIAKPGRRKLGNRRKRK